MAIIFQGQVQHNYYWTQWKSVSSSKLLLVQYDYDGVVYTIYGYDGTEVHTCGIWSGSVPQSVIDVDGYTQAQNDADLLDFQTNYQTKANQAIQPRTVDGRQRIAHEKSDTIKQTIYSHNWADQSTWFTASVLVTGEIPTDSGNHQDYTLVNKNVIDTYHGKLSDEDYLLDSASKSYRVSVTVNGTAKTEQDPHYGTGGDYTVNYAAGVVHFLTANQPTNTVTVTYHYATTADFWIAPPSGGQVMRIDIAEVQFSGDIGITDSVRFQLYAAGNPYGNATVYKTIADFHGDALHAYPSYPPIGGSSWRGIQQSLYVFTWDYVSSTILQPALGMKVKISLDHNTPFTGSVASATFFCLLSYA